MISASVQLDCQSEVPSIIKTFRHPCNFSQQQHIIRRFATWLTTRFDYYFMFWVVANFPERDKSDLLQRC